ncbi:MAG TPA: universal stress protein [Candidatus Binataceae bacterium]|nr:universal stress protein [Candidatus Binataceae bacterium]
MLNYRTILCPIDFDSVSLEALPLAWALAKENRVKVHLLHVARIPNPDMDSPVPFQRDPLWEKQAFERLREIAVRTIEDPDGFVLHVRSGIPDEDVVAFADSLGADLIVMATHGRTGLSHLVLGSVVGRVTQEANCPVLIIRPHPRKRT